MIEFTEFKINNLTASNIIIGSLDNFILPGNALNIDVFAEINGGFKMSDIVNNTELETLLQSFSIRCSEQNGLVIRSLTPIFGQILTEIYPPAITQTENNFTPLGWENSRYVNLTTGPTDQFISGFGATFHGDMKIIRNATNDRKVSLLYNASGSQPQNRILTPENQTFAIKKNSTVNIMYDILIQRWVCMAMEKP